MDKRGFHKMFFIVIAIITLVLLIIYFVTIPRTQDSLQKLSQPETGQTATQQTETSLKNAALDSDEIEKPKDKNNPKAIKPEQLAALKQELIPHQYHQDPYIEARSIIAENAFCFALNDSDGIKSHIKESFKNSQRLSAFKEMDEQCQRKLQSYPVLSEGFENIYQHLKPDSDIGRLLQGILEKSDKDINYQTLLALLKSKNGPLLAEQASMSFMYLSNGEVMPVSQWIDSQNNQYIQQIFQLALTQMACRYQGGVACQPSGMAMLTICSMDNTACGLDFQNYYQQNILPGMQNDVDILVEKFEAMAE